MRARGLGALAGGGAVLLLLALAGAAAPHLAPDPYATDLGARLAAPPAGHDLGQDSLGRDVLARVLHGTRISLALGPSVGNVILALSLLGWTGYARLARAEVAALRQREFVQAAAALGAGPARIVVRHLLPLAAPSSSCRRPSAWRARSSP